MVTPQGFVQNNSNIRSNVTSFLDSIVHSGSEMIFQRLYYIIEIEIQLQMQYICCKSVLWKTRDRRPHFL